MTIQIANVTQLLMSTLVSRLKFEIEGHEISSFLGVDGTDLRIRFIAEKNGSKKILDFSISEQLFDDMSLICGLDRNEEIKKLSVLEITEELRRIENDY